MRVIEQVLLKALLIRLLSNVCSSTIPRSGTAGEQVNCFIVTFHKGDDEADIVLLRRNGDQVEGLKFDGSRYTIDVVFAIAQLDPNDIYVTHFYGLDEIRYQGVWAVARGVWLRWPYPLLHLRRVKNAIAQYLFNRRTLSSSRRLEVLREIVEANMNGTDDVDALDLMSLRYGYRWAGHPEWEPHHQQLKRVLALLAEGGDLVLIQGKYRPTSQALRTIEEAEEADRKHTANYRIQCLLLILTLVSAVMAAAQAGLIKLPVILDLAR